MAKMRAMVVPKVGEKFEAVEREMPEPGAGEMRIRVQACGVCHSDFVTVEGLFPGIKYPRIAGHEVIGVIDLVGPEVHGWTVGERAGVGWFCGSCGYCRRCRRDTAFACENVHGATGVSRDGGYATHMIADVSAVAHVPDDLDSVQSAPLLCAGVTTFNAIRHTGAGPGDLVAVHGVGGLGHLGIQFAAKQGFRTVAVNRGRDKEELGVGPDVRLVEPVGRQEEGKRPAVGAPLRGIDESRIGTLGQRALRERNGFDGGDVGLVSDRHVRLLWKSRPRRRRGRRRENHRHGRAGFATLLFSASIFLSRGLSLTASLSTLTSRRGVSLASMKSSGRSGPH